MPAATEPGAPGPRRRRRILLIATGAAVIGAAGVIVSSVVEESGEGRDTVESATATPAAVRERGARDEGRTGTDGVGARAKGSDVRGGGAVTKEGESAVSGSAAPARSLGRDAAATAPASRPGTSAVSPGSARGDAAAPAVERGAARTVAARGAGAPARPASPSARAPDAGASSHADASSVAPPSESWDDRVSPAAVGEAPDAGARRGATRASPDAGVRRGGVRIAAASAAPDTSERRAEAQAAASRWAVLESRSMRDEEEPLSRVDRFVATGGATLVGRVVDADGGKPVAGTLVHVHHAVALVEGRTDAAGAFRVEGMPSRSLVVVWVGRAGDPFIDERLEVAVPAEGQTADVGTVRLLRGDELGARAEGWVGVFVGRRGSQIVVAGVSPWLPADEAGLDVGDLITSIDGHDVAGLGPRAVTFLLRGRVGAPVAIAVRTRDGQKRKLTLTRVVR